MAPEAYGRQWYPQRFTVSVEQNEPFLTSALSLVDSLVMHALAAGVSAEKLVLGGFSQGACLALEYAAQNPRPYAAVVALSGGLIGETLDTSRDGKDMTGMTVFYSNKIGDNCWRPRECVSNTQQWMAGSISMAHYTMHSDIQVHALWYTCSSTWPYFGIFVFTILSGFHVGWYRIFAS